MSYEMTVEERNDMLDDASMSTDLCQLSEKINDIYLAQGGGDIADLLIMKRCARKIYREIVEMPEDLFESSSYIDSILKSYDQKKHILLCKELFIQTIINQSSNIALSNMLKSIVDKFVSGF